MVTGKAELADWVGASAAVEFAGPVEQAVRESATAARELQFALPAGLRRKRRRGGGGRGSGEAMEFLRSMMRT